LIPELKSFPSFEGVTSALFYKANVGEAISEGQITTNWRKKAFYFVFTLPG
jgi:hypothetical protein